MKKLWTVVLFAFLNFGALALGGFLMGDGPQSDWYVGLNKAPWTPPGWVFGAAWTTIMLCFSFYIAQLWTITNRSGRVFLLFAIQWFLNVLWNPIFFHFHLIFPGLLVIIILTALVFGFLLGYRTRIKFGTLWILPYAIWLLIATSLNAYIFFNN